jgi:hypothetical protein
VGEEEEEPLDPFFFFGLIKAEKGGTGSMGFLGDESR